jgi:hypothetical protein
MGELAYAVGHPAHPDTPKRETHTSFEYDYAPDHPARGGQGQPVLTEQGSHIPVDGHKHLYGLAGYTLAERQESFAELSALEQERRREWNVSGIPPEEIEEG